MERPTEECKKCKGRHKLLTKAGLCFACDYPNWEKEYRSIKIK